MNKVIEAERKIENKLRVKNRIKFHNSQVRKYINDNTLSGKQKKDIDNVYKKYVGKWKYDFHEFYSQKTGVFSSYYIPDDLYYGYVDLFFNNWEAANYIDNKCYYDILFPEFKQPETIAKRINNFWCIDGKIVSFNETVSYISNNKCGRIFIKKATDSHGGGGVFCVKDVSKTQNIKKIISGIKGDIIIQRGVIQCNSTRKLNENSVNTVRMLSFLDKTGNVKIYSRIIRMGVGDKAIDNASSGGITCGIEKDGRLKPKAFDTKGNIYEKHPTTGVVFSDIVLPSLDTAENLIRQAHIKIPHFRLVSWDIAFDEKDEPVLIEANLKDGEIDFHQLNNGPLFGDDTENVLGEVFGGR